MSNTQLKPCPFCGGEAEITQFGDNRKSTLYTCLDCGASLETGETFNHGERWNERKVEREMCELLGSIADLANGDMGNLVDEMICRFDDIEELLAKVRGD